MIRRILLSKYFDENVQLVAGMCHKCYQECDEVKIIGVNSMFLKKMSKIKKVEWIPPRSPHNLVEESLHDNPWGLLVATIFLNKTSCFCARPAIEKFLEDYPDPWSVLEKKPEDLLCYFDTIGLRKRAFQVWKMSYDYLHKPWKNVGELYGIGRYGQDAFQMFCLGNFSVEPEDRFLKIYKAWYLMKEKEERS